MSGFFTQKLNKRSSIFKEEYQYPLVIIDASISIMTALGYAIWYRLLGLYEVNQVMPFLLLLPVMSIAGSMLFLGERLSQFELLGSGVVIVGVAIITTHKNRSAKVIS